MVLVVGWIAHPSRWIAHPSRGVGCSLLWDEVLNLVDGWGGCGMDCSLLWDEVLNLVEG